MRRDVSAIAELLVHRYKDNRSDASGGERKNISRRDGHSKEIIPVVQLRRSIHLICLVQSSVVDVIIYGFCKNMYCLAIHLDLQ